MHTVVFTGKTDKGKEVIIRYPAPGDADVMMNFINTVSDERTFISFQGEQMTLSEEQEFLDDQLEKIDKHEAVLLLVFAGDEMIGSSGIEMGVRATRHVGNFGIAIARDHREEGVGTLLMQTVINEAITRIPELEIVALTVFANNPRARNMYDKFGFVNYGTIPDGVKLVQSYVDHECMYKRVKNEHTDS